MLVIRQCVVAGQLQWLRVSEGAQFKCLLSGIQPMENSYQLRNCLGTVTQWIELQGGYDPFYFIPNLPVITADQDPVQLCDRTLVGVTQLLAKGPRV